MHINEFRRYSLLRKKQNDQYQKNIDRPSDKEPLFGNEGNDICFEGCQIKQEQQDQGKAIVHQMSKGKSHLQGAVLDICGNREIPANMFRST